MNAHLGSFTRTALACAMTLGLCAAASAKDFDFQFRASGDTPFAPDCNGSPQTGTLFTNAEVEPYVSVNPRNPLNLIGVWQQDRWSNGGAQGLGTGFSFNGGVTWSRVFVPFSRCAGGNAANGGDYERASDPWVSISPNGVAHSMSLSIIGLPFTPGGVSAMLHSRSTDGGRTWGPVNTLIRDADATLFNDKNAMTADPTDSRYVYGIWDRLSDDGVDSRGPTLLARSTDNGATWEPARIIYDPGSFTQTIGNLLVVLPNGTLINFFTQINQLTGASFYGVIRSTDKGLTWSAPIKVADDFGIGTQDPENGTPIRDGAGIGSIAVGKKGELYATWADSRFSGGARDGIAFVKSTDGGLTWSEPVQINSVPSTQAFTPYVHVRYDGTIGVTHYDLRSNTTDPANLPTEYWLLRSKDGGKKWKESKVTGPFDLATAPNARGLFLGDYQGLTSIGPIFVPFYAQTTGDLNNRTDIFSELAINALKRSNADQGSSAKRVEEEEEALPSHAAFAAAAAVQMTDEMQQKRKAKVDRLMQGRVDKWMELQQRRAGK
jgi:BNR repeat-like domain